MDLKDIANKSSLISAIKNLLNSYEKFLTTLVNDSSENYHLAALLYYWLRDFIIFLKREKSFNPLFLKSYSRGDIISVNFGFNIGSEYGGRHYAVVIENNDRKSHIITVIPLRSVKPKDINGVHKSELYLGDELYKQLDAKIQLKLQTATNPKEIASLQDFQKQFSKMKRGSVAVIKQITTIDKMRILTPIKTTDVLSGIKLSTTNLNLIDKKIVEIYTNKQPLDKKFNSNI